MAQDGGKVVSLTHRPLLPQEILLVLISARGWVDPRTTVRAEGISKWKIAMTPQGIEPATFWFVAQHLNPLTPKDPYSGRTAPLTSKRCILYIYSTNAGTEYFKYFTVRFFSSKWSLFHNSNVFVSCFIQILYTVCAKIKKKIIPAPKV